MLPKDSAERKAVPLAQGCLFYFPDALAAVAELSRKGNDKHNPGQPLHWSREKSNDHLDCIARHLVDAGKKGDAVDAEDGVLHVVKVAWRALAQAQLALEAQHQPVTPEFESCGLWWLPASGAMPVKGDANVCVLLRVERDSREYVHDVLPASDWSWDWDDRARDFDIVGYQVVS